MGTYINYLPGRTSKIYLPHSLVVAFYRLGLTVAAEVLKDGEVSAFRASQPRHRHGGDWVDALDRGTADLGTYLFRKRAGYLIDVL